jgi:hypothetical protein
MTRTALPEFPKRLASTGNFDVRTVAEYRKFAEDCRQLAAKLSDPQDRLALELMAAGWEKVANEREAALKRKEPPQSEAAR